MLTERGGSPGARNKATTNTEQSKPRMRKKGAQSSADLTRSSVVLDIQLVPCVAFSVKSNYNKKNSFLWVWWQVHNVMLRFTIGAQASSFPVISRQDQEWVLPKSIHIIHKKLLINLIFLLFLLKTKTKM